MKLLLLFLLFIINGIIVDGSDASGSGDDDDNTQYQQTVDHIRRIAKRKNPENYYTFDETIGFGRYGSTYKAYSKKSPKKAYAIKKMDCGTSLRLTYAINEIILSRKINHHPNVIAVEEAYYYRNDIYLVMKYIDGDILDEVSSDFFSEKSILIIGYQSFHVLKDFQSANICHEDIDGSNTMIDLDNRKFYFIDFGNGHSISSDTHSSESDYLYTNDCNDTKAVANMLKSLVDRTDIDSSSVRHMISLADKIADNEISIYEALEDSIFDGISVGQSL